MRNVTKLFSLMLLLLTGQHAFAIIHTISVGNNSYTPSALTINAGDSVLFSWVDGDHPTASDNSAWPTFQMNSANPSQILKLPAGNYPYYCTVHGAPGGAGMGGTITVMSVSGIKDQVAPALFTIVPNPCAGAFAIHLKQSDAGKSKIEVANAIGKVVKVIELNKFDPGQTISVDLKVLPAGLYFCTLICNDKIAERKRLVLQL